MSLLLVKWGLIPLRKSKNDICKRLNLPHSLIDIHNFFLSVFNYDLQTKCSFSSVAKKLFKIHLIKSNRPIFFNVGFTLLLIKVDFIPKKQSCKRDKIKIYSTSNDKLVLALLIKVVKFHVWTFLIKVGILFLEKLFTKFCNW